MQYKYATEVAWIKVVQFSTTLNEKTFFCWHTKILMPVVFRNSSASTVWNSSPSFQHQISGSSSNTNCQSPSTFKIHGYFPSWKIPPEKQYLRSTMTTESCYRLAAKVINHLSALQQNIPAMVPLGFQSNIRHRMQVVNHWLPGQSFWLLIFNFNQKHKIPPLT